MNFFYETCKKKKENVNFIFKFIPSSYIKIVVKLKIKKCWPYELVLFQRLVNIENAF